MKIPKFLFIGDFCKYSETLSYRKVIGKAKLKNKTIKLWMSEGMIIQIALHHSGFRIFKSSYLYNSELLLCREIDFGNRRKTKDGETL